MDVVLVILALLGAAIGGVSLSNATAGVGFLAGACLLAILARMAQAGRQHRETRRLLERILQVGMQTPGVTPAAVAWACPQCGQHNGTDVFACARCNTPRAWARRG